MVQELKHLIYNPGVASSIIGRVVNATLQVIADIEYIGHLSLMLIQIPRVGLVVCYLRNWRSLIKLLIILKSRSDGPTAEI